MGRDVARALARVDGTTVAIEGADVDATLLEVEDAGASANDALEPQAAKRATPIIIPTVDGLRFT